MNLREHKGNLYHLPQIGRDSVRIAVLLYPSLDEEELRKINLSALLLEEGIEMTNKYTALTALLSKDVFVRTGRLYKRGSSHKLFYGGKSDITFKSGLVLRAGEDFDLKEVCGEPKSNLLPLAVDEIVVAANCHRIFGEKGSIGPEDIAGLSKETAYPTSKIQNVMVMLDKKGVLKEDKNNRGRYEFGPVVLVALIGKTNQTELFPGKIVFAGEKVDLTSFHGLGTKSEPKKEASKNGEGDRIPKLSLRGSIIAVALWDYFDDEKGKLFDCRPIGRNLNVEEADVLKVFNRLVETGFFAGDSRSHLRGHGKFTPSFGLATLTSVTLGGGRVLVDGEKYDLRKPVTRVASVSPAFAVKNKNGDGYAGKVVVVVTHGPEEAAKLVTCIVDSSNG
ncbi:MAG: hypothetical protein M1324_02075 [Patescibacteria group bacterium]|nr:hypothetical protein [Patescibacteria group bacterium]